MPNPRSARLLEIHRNDLARMLTFVRADLEARINPEDILYAKMADNDVPPRIAVKIYGSPQSLDPIIAGVAKERCLRATRPREPDNRSQTYHFRFRDIRRYLP